MIDPNFIRTNSDKVKENIRNRGGATMIVDEWLETDTKRSNLIQQINEFNQKKNQLAELGKQGGDIESVREQGRVLKDQTQATQEQLDAVEAAWQSLIHQMPNLALDEVPVGKGESDNIELRKWGEIPQFDFTPKGHDELGKDLDMFDFEAGAKVSGSQFYYLKNDGVMLEYALIQFGLEMLQKKGYTLVQTPDLAKSRFYLGTGYAPKGDEAQIYEIEGEDLGLIATAEVTMAGMFADEILDAAQLPMKFAAISHCFRKEAGAYGKYSKALYRVHQFTKLELFIYCTPEQSADLHLELLAIEEEIAQAIGIPYRVLEMCTGDLGAIAARKYDLEAWMPGRQDYGEITSTSNVTDYQARTLNIKYKSAEGKNEFAHMLNGTAIVMSRFPVAIMENFQQADGSIKVPEVLQKYMGKAVISK
jgi:seryl-tRNA synthetase